MRILVFGGSFDPPHRGHTALLAAAARRTRPDRIVLIPAFRAPLKGSPAAPAAQRVRLVRLGLIPALSRRWRDLCTLDLSEVRSGRRVYTVETLRALRRRHPGAELHFVTGSDSAATFGSWKRPAELEKLAVWWTGTRPGTPRGFPRHFRRLAGRFPAVSSTGLRDALALGLRPPGLAPAVLRHILKRKLYGSFLAREVRRMLGEGRFAHTRAVAEQAVRLARLHGVDPDKARLAALLHDLGRTLPVRSMGAYAQRRGLTVPARARVMRENPLLLHSYISADMARRRFGIQDREVLRAVSRHTLGGPGMSALEKTLYVADVTSDDRSFAGVSRIRKLARRDLARAFRACVRLKLDWVRRTGSWLHPLTASLWGELR